ncbi:hypothetical protein Tco_0139809 [Tanacetum coccineum]
MDKRKRFKLNLEIFRDIFKICPRVHGQDFDALPTDEEIVSFLRELGHTREINSLNDVVVDQMHQPWRTFAALINRSLSGKTTGATPPKKARKFKKPTSPQLSIVLVSPKEPTGKSKRKKKKVDVARGKGIDLISKVELTKEAQYEEVRKKSLRDFHKTYPSGSSIVTKTAPSAAKIKPSVTNQGTGVKPGVPDVTEEESSESEAESWGNDEDDSNNDHNSESDGSDQENDSDDDKTLSDNENESDSEHETDENESEKITDKADVDTDKGFIQEEGTDAEITISQQGNENPEISQVIEDAHVTLSTVPQKAKVPVTSSSHLSDLASKFLNFSDIPHTNAAIISPMDVYVHHEVPRQHTPTLLMILVLVIIESSPIFTTVIPQSLPSFTPPPQQSTSTPPPTTEATNPQSALPNLASVFQFNNRVTSLEKEVADLKKDPLHTQVTALVDDHLDARLGATRDEFMNYLSTSITTRITEQVKIQLPQMLPKEVSNFAPPEIQRMVTESLEQAILAKESSQPQSSYEAAATLIEFELKKILIDKMDKSESYLAAPEHRECYEGLIKSYDLDKTLFSTYDKVYSLKRSRKDKDKDEDPSAGSDRGLKKRKTSKDAEPTKEEPEFKVADSDMPQDQEGNLGNDDDEPMNETVSKHDWFTKPTQPQEPTDPD